MLVATYCPLALETETVLPSARLVPAAAAGPADSSGSMAAAIPARASAAIRSLRDLLLSRMASSCRRADGWHAAEPCPRPDVRRTQKIANLATDPCGDLIGLCVMSYGSYICVTEPSRGATCAARRGWLRGLGAPEV